jgi:hypothetical protein
VPYQDQAVIGLTPVSGADGTIFYQYSPLGPTSGLSLYANRGGAQHWQIPLPVGRVDQEGITVGSDGNPYYVISDASKPRHSAPVKVTERIRICKP